MRFLVKVSIPVDTGNASAKEGFSTMQKILEEQKPEAAYFVAENGQRTAYLVLHLDDASQIPAIAEPWFLAFEADIDAYPAMVPEDLMKAAPAIAAAVEKYG